MYDIANKVHTGSYTVSSDAHCADIANIIHIWPYTVSFDTQCVDVATIVHILSYSVSCGAQCVDIAEIELNWSYTISSGTQRVDIANIVHILSTVSPYTQYKHIANIFIPGPALHHLTPSVPILQTLYTTGRTLYQSETQRVDTAIFVHTRT